MQRRRKHVWTPQLDERLRRTYKSAHSREALSEGITRIQRLTSFPRSVIVSRAADLGLAIRRGRLWNSREIAALREEAGIRPVSVIARRLKRSYYSVKGELHRLQLSARMVDGYSQQDLQRLLGVSSKRVRQWIELHWLTIKDGRVPENEVVAFLKRHPNEYQLNRVEEAWFKGLVFPAFNSAKLHNGG